MSPHKLRDLLALEAELSEANLKRLGPLAAFTDVFVGLCADIQLAGESVGSKAAFSLGRLMLDACGHVEQALLALIRGQPRLAWAALRIAAEATKDLHAIARDPGLDPLWRRLAESQDPSAGAAAQRAFKKARQKLSKDAEFEVCQAIMDLGSMFGAHPNSLSIGGMGNPRRVAHGTLEMSLRLQDPVLLAAYTQAMLQAVAQLLNILIEFRLPHLEPEERAKLDQAAANGMNILDQLAEAMNSEPNSDAQGAHR